MSKKVNFGFIARVFQRPLRQKMVGGSIFALICLNGGAGNAQVTGSEGGSTQAKTGVARSRITDEQLKKAREDLAASSQESNKFKVKSRPKPVEKPAQASKTDIYQISDVLIDGEFHTVVPKGSILSMPESLSNRLAPSAVGKFQFWPDFYARNKSWIKLQEVEVDVAKGKAPLPEAVVKMMETEPKVVIAAFKGNLVTVLEAPPKEGDVEKTGEKK